MSESGGRVNRSEFLVRVAARAKLDSRVTQAVYDALIAEILEIVGAGDRLTLTGFGKFYPQWHKGHRVQRVSDAGRLEGAEDAPTVADYAVLKFSATRTVNKSMALPKVLPAKPAD